MNGRNIVTLLLSAFVVSDALCAIAFFQMGQRGLAGGYGLAGAIISVAVVLRIKGR